MKPSTSPRGVIQAACAMILVGTLTAVSAAISRYPVYGGQAVRYAVAAVILLTVARSRERSGRTAGRPPARSRLTLREWSLVTALAATGLVGFNLCVVEGTRHTTPAMIGTVVGAVPVVLAVVAPLMERRRPAPHLVAAAVIVTLGAAAANGLGGGSLSGLLLALGALVGEMAFSLLAVPLLPRLGPVRVSAYSAAVATPMLLAVGLIVDGTAVVRIPTAGEVAGFAYLAVIVTVGAFVLWYDALGRIGADRAGLFAGLIPVSAAATTMVLGLGTPNAAELTGALLVGCGVAAGLGGGAASRRVSRRLGVGPREGAGERYVAGEGRAGREASEKASATVSTPGRPATAVAPPSDQGEVRVADASCS
ncbi:DMT family transporter [Actinoallomurus purpureus]|uniref:DMT family transporter n=1 Tax=Actinoallomurus purpureus TaxID=478114 RepID=UPI002093AEBF|nr:DMT family transporter [Actinoallomurus purpureus]MCO6006657.1 DMT family transporter [Actinoallomurus purpureus]